MPEFREKYLPFTAQCRMLIMGLVDATNGLHNELLGGLFMTKSKDELLESLSQLEIVIDNLPFNVWLKSEEGNYLVVNKKFEESSGKTKEEIIGASCCDIFGKSKAEKCTTSDRKAIRGEIQGYYEEEDKKGNCKETFKKTVKNDAGEIVLILII